MSKRSAEVSNLQQNRSPNCSLNSINEPDVPVKKTRKSRDRIPSNKESSFYKSTSSNSIESRANKSLAQEPAKNVDIPVLNLDCLVYIFEHNMSILEMIKLRTVCRSWNAAVCEVLVKKNTLKVFPGRELLAHEDRLPICYEERKSHPILRISDRPEHENVVLLGVCYERNVASFVSFLRDRMPNITKLVLVLEVDAFWFRWSWFESILDSVPNMETFFLSLVNEHDREEQRWDLAFVHTTSISRQKALEVMHRSFQKRPSRLRELFLSQKYSFFPRDNPPNYIDDLLEGLESLSCENLPTNIKPKPSLRKLSVDNWSKSYSSIFPNLETLKVGFQIGFLLEDIETKFMPNLKHLKFDRKLWLDSVNIMSRLNSLPKLEQLTCENVIVPSEFVPSLTKHFNSTITRLDLTGEIYKVPDFLQNELPKILKTFVSLKQMTIRYNLENKERYFKDVCYKELLRLVPKGLNLKLIETNRGLESFRYMGRFREILEKKIIDNSKGCSCKGSCGRGHSFAS